MKRQGDPNIQRCDHRASHPHLYTAAGVQAMEDQAVMLVTSLITATHAQSVLEVGTWRGTTARALAVRLATMATDGHLDVVDSSWDAIRAASRHLMDVGSRDGFTWAVHHGNVHAWEPSRAYDVIVLDADWNNRHAEYHRVAPWVRPGGLIVVHDTGTASPGRAGTLRALADLGHAHLDLALPRGLVVAQVPWAQEDQA